MVSHRNDFGACVFRLRTAQVLLAANVTQKVTSLPALTHARGQNIRLLQTTPLNGSPFFRFESTQVKKIIAEKDTLLAEVNSICIQGRNAYSRRAIKQDFAMGIKELDQENAAEEDEANFDPEVDIRDYDAVAESLPVFCVSSRAFQKLSGRLQKDDVNSA
ncbi:hypothetical protein VTK56DRAFT_5081 [Thermocarpiscus australiensis]